jgi:hypothetical protein
MRVLSLRRAGFAATLATGILLTGTALHGVSGMDTTLELAAAPDPARSVLASHHERVGGWGDCPQRPDDRPRFRT